MLDLMSCLHLSFLSVTPIFPALFLALPSKHLTCLTQKCSPAESSLGELQMKVFFLWGGVIRAKKAGLRHGAWESCAGIRHGSCVGNRHMEKLAHGESDVQAVRESGM